MILHDPHALHRRWWDRNWKPGIGDDTWTDWDFLLAKAYQLIEDYTNSETGQWRPYDESGAVSWDVRSTFSGSKAALEKAREGDKELKPGESLYAVPIFDDEELKPTLESWAKELEEDSSSDGIRPPEAKGSRPPTREEIMEIIKNASNSAKLD